MAEGNDYYFYNRSWMYKRHFVNGALNADFIRGVERFLKFANRRGRPEEIRCPCKKCKNMRHYSFDEVKDHLLQKGFVEDYYDWRCHDLPGEENYSFKTIRKESQLPPVEPQNNKKNQCAPMVRDAATNRFSGPRHTFLPRNDSSYAEQHMNPQAKQFFDMLSVANNPLYPGCKTYTKMSMLGRLINMKKYYHCSERLFDEFCSVIQDALPQPNSMTPIFYDMKKQLAALGLQSESIDCCINGCMIYWGSTVNDRRCSTCGKKRYSKDANGKRHSRKQFFYLPLGPRLRRLYESRVTASQMRWHAEHHRENGEMCHPSDSEAWLNFNSTHPEFAAETRNVRLGLYTDGLNPFGNSGRQYSSWPVILTPYNLPPWMCMNKPYMFLTVIAPGPINPGHNIDIYLQPLIHELNYLWTEGIETYDVSRRQNFRLKAALMWTISDFPAYSMLSGWSTHGKNACPHCGTDSKSFYLKNSRKMCWFDCHRRFLPDHHPFRRDTINFLPGVREDGHAPSTRTSTEVLEELNRFGMLRVCDGGAREYNDHYGPYTGGWKKKSIFWDLPYWKTNMIRNCLDVMHIEKNFFDNIFNTVLRVENASKDHLAARCDLRNIGIRKTLHPNGNEFPMATFTLDDEQILVILQWLKTLRFPDGYISDLERNIDMKKHSIFGMKSHDGHVFMQRLIPIAFRELLPLPVWEALTELSLFFKKLTSSKLILMDLRKLENEIPVILCKLEKIFPPSFFDCIEHLPIHLPYEARVAGPVQYRWMYPFERYIRHLKFNLRNKANVEASICDAYLTEEASHFVSHYFGPEIPYKYRDPRMHDDGGYNNDRSGVISIFTHPIRFYGKGKKKLMDDIDLKIAHCYVLMNCTEIEPFLRRIIEGIRAKFPSLSQNQLDAYVKYDFPRLFQEFAKAGFLDGSPNEHILKEVAKGPLKYVQSYSMCYANGYKFYTLAHATRKATDNCGVCVKSAYNSQDGEDFYGRLEEIVELEYPGMPRKRVTLFRCHWYDPTRIGHEPGTRVHQRYQIVDINIIRSYRKYDPFVLASKASQVYYMAYPSTMQDLRDWRTVCEVKSKNYEVNVELGKDIDDSAFQDEGQFQFYVSQEDNLTSESLRDPFGRFIQCNVAAEPYNPDDVEKELDEDLILSSGDEEDSDEESFSSSEEEDVR